MTSTHPSHDLASPVRDLSNGFHFIAQSRAAHKWSVITENNWKVKPSGDVWWLEGVSAETVSSFSPDQIFSCKTKRAESVRVRFPSKVLGRMIGPGSFDISCSHSCLLQPQTKRSKINVVESFPNSDAARDPPPSLSSLLWLLPRLNCPKCD